MKTLSLSSLLLSASLVFSGCATQQETLLAKSTPPKISSVAQIPEEGNSPDMNANLAAALQTEGLSIKPPLPAGTRKSSGVDAIVSYTDVWRWDLVMYLKSINVRLYDAKSGDLVATGQWQDSQLHGFRDAKVIVQGVVSEMMAKIRAAAGSN